VAEGNGRWGHGEVVEGAGGEGDEQRGVEPELGEVASGSGDGRRRLALMGPRWQRAAKHSGGGRAWERRRSGGGRALLNVARR
jgi:hypothetical protein